MTDAYALAHFVDVTCERLQDIRRRYDPRYGLIGPHITLVFPVPAGIGESRLSAHIGSVLGRWRPFSVRLCRLWCSDDAHLYLVPALGADELVRMIRGRAT
jgi:2'-5' RNA ligase superfamily